MKSLSIITALILAAFILSPAYAVDPDYTFEESLRTGVTSNILGVAATAAGDLSIASNVFVGGNSTVTGTVTVTGASTLTGTVNVNAIDGVGAVDLDYGSADITDHTFVSDGGTAIIDGNITMGADAVLDATGAVDMDYGSADITDHTFTSDGGTAVIDGTAVFSDDVTCDKIIFTDASTAAPTNALSRGFLVTINGTNFWFGLYPVND